MKMPVVDVAVIGAGPAGIAAAIQLKRFGLEPAVIERERIGGLLVNANLVENYPGFPSGIRGVDLVRLFEAQLQRVGVRVSFEEVVALDYAETFVLKTTRREFGARSVVIATGTRPRSPEGIEIPANAKARVFFEVHPIAEVEGKTVAIVGAGDAAFDYALNLSRRNDVVLLNRTVRRRCLPLLWERVQRTSRIAYKEDTILSAVHAAGERLRLIVTGRGGAWELEADYVIFAIGRIPCLDFLSERIKAQIDRLEGEGMLYRIGDVKNGLYRQTAIAVGDGIRAAMSICERFGDH